MTRPLRIEYPGAWYHVMNRGRRSEPVFLDRKDYQLFVDLLKEISELWNVNIAAYCLMTNHYHLLAQTPDANISRVMRHLNSVYTQRFNKRHGLDGSLFRGRFKSILVYHDNYLLELTRYIHKNPVKANIVKNMKDFQWSSYKGYLSYSSSWDWIYKDFIFEMITKKKKGRLTPFIKFMEQDESDEINRLFSLGKLPSIIGPDNFVKRIKEEFYFKKKSYEVPDSNVLNPEPKDIVKEVCKFYKVKESELKITRRGFFNKPRNIGIYLVRYMCNERLTDIAEYFEMNTYSAVSNTINKVGVLKKKDKKVSKEIDQLIKKIGKGQMKI